MHLIQILLPLYDNARQPLPPDEYLHVRNELTERFGGLTVYTRAPAEGLWRQNDNLTSRDDIVIFEVMGDGSGCALVARISARARTTFPPGRNFHPRSANASSLALRKRQAQQPWR